MEKTVSEISFSEAIENLKDEYVNIWRDTEDSFPCLDMTYSRGEQSEKEKELDKRIKKLTKELKVSPVSEEKKIIWRDKVKWAAREIGGSFFGFKEDETSRRVLDEFSRSAEDFIKEARLFNPDMSLEDINQAIRNLWIANSIQNMLDIRIGLTPSIFAYSMLYPYTDNFLDDPYVTAIQKKEINARFKKRLAGEHILPGNCYEDALFRLIDMIESEYSREAYPKVFDSLLGIHKAQEKSLLQHVLHREMSVEDIIDISFEKGGTSVLADAFLADGRLSWKNVSFMFGFGVFLQLIDDAEDSFEDLKNEHMTIFSQLAGNGKLDEVTNKLFHFIDKVMDGQDGEGLPNLGKLKDIIRNNSYFLILEAVAKNSSAYSASYVKEMERFSPYSFSFLLKMKKKLRKQYHLFDLKKIEV